SRPTVSKYFNDPDSVRKSTRAQIEKALAKYEYRPNLFAVNLNKKRPKIVGLIVPDTADTFFSELVRRIEMRCVERGYLAIVLSSRGDAQLEARSIETLLSLKIAGAIVAPLGVHSDQQLIRSLRARIPMVFLDSSLDEDTPFVGTNNFQSVPLITEYLCRSGDAPTYFDMPAVNQNGPERKLAYVTTMQRLGLKPEVVAVTAKNDWRFEDIAFEEAQRVLRGPGFPTRTVLCANDRCAVGVMAAAFQHGLRIGREPGCDIRIVRDDGSELRGEDLLLPVGRKGKRGRVPFAIRFHIGPVVELGLSEGGKGAGLALPDGTYWQFVAGAGALESSELTVEESLWVDGGGKPHPIQQLVLQGMVSRGGGSF
ncbi:MAG: heparinase II/III family protein, partial [Rhizobiales bacterium]|nr:heparinase II/III family protein [Hyphomicrobiales bacterium]